MSARLPEFPEDGVPYDVLALDPGGETGWAIFSLHPDAMGPDPAIRAMANVLHWSCGELVGSRNSQVDEILRIAAAWPDARIVSERFKVRRLDAILEPDRINAVLEWTLRPRYLTYQNPDDAMSTVTDQRQKDWGLWVPGKEHARDAIKHAVTFIKRMKERSIRAGSVSSTPRSE